MDIGTAKDFIEDLQTELARLNQEIRDLQKENQHLKTLTQTQSEEQKCFLRGPGCGCTAHPSDEEVQK